MYMNLSSIDDRREIFSSYINLNRSELKDWADRPLNVAAVFGVGHEVILTFHINQKRTDLVTNQ